MLDKNGQYYYEERLHDRLIILAKSDFGLLSFIENCVVDENETLFQETELELLLDAVINCSKRDITPATRKYLETIIAQIERDLPNEW